MKVALIAPSVYVVPPVEYGGLEGVLGDLAFCLAGAGHKVTLFAPEGSKVQSVKVVPTGAPGQLANPEKAAFEVYRDELESFDVVHDHTWQSWVYTLPHAGRLPIIKTIHGMCPWHSAPPVKTPCLVGVSKANAQHLSGALGVPVRHVYNGVQVERYPLEREKEDRIAFVSRMNVYKGAHEAVSIAKRLGLPIDIVGEDVFVEDHAYVQRVRQACDGKRAVYHGRVSNEEKLAILQKARWFISPLLPPWEEPFGLHVVEAMLCGCDAYATDSGAMRELLPGGRVFRTVADLEAALPAPALMQVPPERCREHALRWSRERMTVSYLDLYKSVVAGRRW